MHQPFTNHSLLHATDLRFGISQRSAGDAPEPEQQLREPATATTVALHQVVACRCGTMDDQVTCRLQPGMGFFPTPRERSSPLRSR